MTALPAVLVDVDDDMPTCRVCGCDDLHACVLGVPPYVRTCHWVAIDLCSACEGT
jgi:hypothetical protein